ncbi:MAG: hypothetical protein COY74_10225, partial [Nitrosopumilales archaeon CG_4_10_14_0_8_um_filter_34_8]
AKYYETTQTDWPASGYKNTIQMTEQTFLSKTVNEWQKVSFDELRKHHESYGKSGFFEDLGVLLIKNEMLYQLKQQNIANANDDFAVFSGLALTSLPPHITFEAVVNGTDGNSYRLQGTTFANSVSNVKITKLEFADTEKKISLDSILPQNQIIQILPKTENGPQVEPFDLVIDSDRHNIVGFENNQAMPVQILGGNDYQNLQWTGPIIFPYGKATMTFNETGVYEWSAHSLPVPGNGWRERYGNGEINVLSDKTSDLPLSEKGRIASAIIKNSEIPWSGIGTRIDGLYIEFNCAIFEMLPDAKKYYSARADQMVPFEVPIAIDSEGC